MPYLYRTLVTETDAGPRPHERERKRASPARAPPMPPNSPALRKKYDRRQQEVVAIAAARFARRGFQATSMDELSQATGLRSGGLYHYIGSKQRLLFQIFQQLMDPLLERAGEIEAGDADPEHK